MKTLQKTKVQRGSIPEETQEKHKPFVCLCECVRCLSTVVCTYIASYVAKWSVSSVLTRTCFSLHVHYCAVCARLAYSNDSHHVCDNPGWIRMLIESIIIGKKQMSALMRHHLYYL